MFNRPARSSNDLGQSSKRTTLALVVAGLSLFVALDGPAVAAQSLVKARDIASGAVTSTKIKRKAVTVRHLSPRARRALKGAEGTTGATGSAGANGLSGTNGANGLTGSRGTDGVAGTNGTDGTDGTDGVDGVDGTVTPLTVTAGPIPLLTATPPTTVVERAVPVGKYIVLGKTQITHSGAGDSIHCELKAGAQVIDQVDMKTLPALAAIPVSMQAVTTTTSPDQVSITCDVSVADGNANYSSIIAIPAN